MKEKVYAFLRTIPQGKVVTYGDIAAHLGNKNLLEWSVTFSIIILMNF